MVKVDISGGESVGVVGRGDDGLEDVGNDALWVLEPDGGGVALHLHGKVRHLATNLSKSCITYIQTEV